ncbi:ATP-binding protein [Zobellia nedashkovskayae]|uniref:ATP-binding protein n=1 Tax=Zobellia nedashkovskayae TaxID=2779510 RepID=UPI001889DA11|nr:ATP-binding protein [Zobellia nedashkovskayae]
MEKFKKQIFELRNYSDIQKICQYAHTSSKFLIIAGETGSGKTEGLVSYSQKNGENIKYVRLRKSMSTSHFFTEISNAYNYGGCTRRSFYHFMNWIKAYIEESNEKHLLIVDEGGMFNNEQLGLFHELRDLTENNLGIILAGPKYFVEKLKNWNSLQKNGVPEFYRRINRIIPLNDLTKEEIIGVCNAYGVKSKDINNRFLGIKNIGDLTNSIENYLYLKENSAT